jgi:ParB family chromosome partitioning protein
MSEPTSKITRLQIARERHAAGNLGKTDTEVDRRRVIHIEHLVEDPKNERKTFRGVDGLAASIKEEGLIEPLTVTAIDGGKFLILTGHRRFRAIKQLGLEKVEVIVRAPENDDRRRVKSLISNIQREDVPPLELAEALNALTDEIGLGQGEIAKRIGKTKAWISDVLTLLDLPKPLREKVQTSELSVSVDSLSRIARLEDPQLQEFVLDALLSGATVRQIRDLIREVAPEKKPASKKGQAVSAPTKPKKVFPTEHKAVVIVQGTTGRLTSDQTIAALQDALKAAKKPSKDS